MVREATNQDVDILADLAILMWTNDTLEDLKAKFNNVIKKDDTVFFLFYKSEQPIGFSQCQLRYDYVEGTESSPVGYLEGIFVIKEFRNNGYARSLLRECEKWAKSKGCKEFASDCELINETSLSFHINMGFAEVNRIICFTKKL